MRVTNLSRILIFNSQNREGEVHNFLLLVQCRRAVVSRCRYVGAQISRIYTGVRGASHKKGIMEPVVR